MRILCPVESGIRNEAVQAIRAEIIDRSFRMFLAALSEIAEINEIDEVPVPQEPRPNASRPACHPHQNIDRRLPPQSPSDDPSAVSTWANHWTRTACEIARAAAVSNTWLVTAG